MLACAYAVTAWGKVPKHSFSEGLRPFPKPWLVQAFSSLYYQLASPSMFCCYRAVGAAILMTLHTPPLHSLQYKHLSRKPMVPEYGSS